MKEDQLLSILAHHVPDQAIAHCLSLWKDTPFQLKLSRSRETKVGDFTTRHHLATPRISLNNNLTPHLFLMTYIHEVAHLRVYLHYGKRVNPHGEEWKIVFRQLLLPILTNKIFPEPIFSLLVKHMQNPKASSFVDAELTKAFRLLENNGRQVLVLSDLPEGSIFHLHGRFFKKGKLKRTRFLCHEVKSRKAYLVPAEATVSHAQLSLL